MAHTRVIHFSGLLLILSVHNGFVVPSLDDLLANAPMISCVIVAMSKMPYSNSKYSHICGHCT